jgi:hypothetical protein
MGWFGQRSAPLPIFRSHRKRPPEVKVSRRYTNPATAQSRRIDGQTLRFSIAGNEFEILGLPAVARWLKCTQARAIQLVTEGKLRGHRFGRVWIVMESDLDKHVQARRRELKSRYQSYLEDEFMSED